ncbi:MAG: uridine kinase family protein [bacterium]
MVDVKTTPPDMRIIAVAGGSGSGKTLFSQLLAQRLPKAEVLPLDAYYLDKPSGTPVEQYNFDVPQAFDFKLFHQHITELQAGRPIRKPHYGWVEGKRTRETTRVVPGSYLVIEGLYVLMSPSLRSQLAYSFFLESPLDIALARRVLRDIHEHGVTPDYSINQYLTFVRPAYLQHIYPTKQFAHYTVPNDQRTRLDRFLDDFLSKYML